ncbi:BQ2448_7913 [Microbotryum intermedium]|uniref:BQ2448_7913 protein n=1 Tax=Microbotryum intermedium TaxID=269621 RepID=A0A238FSQ5_9BASI|nr:BQ2448_7913 [Microbotryum intermedium]
MPPSDQLERSQRAHSTAALASSADVTHSGTDAASVSPESSLPSVDACTAPRTPGLLAQQGRSKSMMASTTLRTSSSPTLAHYSSREFEADPFEHAHLTPGNGSSCSGTSMHRSLSSFSSGALAAHEQGDWLERLGKRATTFGRWTTDHSSDHSVGGSRDVGAPLTRGGGAGTRPHQPRPGDDEDSDESTDEEQGHSGLHIPTSIANRDRPNGGPTRNKSSLSVFHDQFETAEDHTVDFDYTSSQPTSPAPSRPRSRPSSAPTSPRTGMRRLEPLSSPNGRTVTRAEAEHEAELLGIDLDDPDVLAHQLLSAQDKLGVFSLVESALEWPWSSSVDPKRLAHKNRRRDPSFADSRTSERPTPLTKSLPVSRVASHHSLSHLVDDYLLNSNSNALFGSSGVRASSLSSARMTPVGSSDLNHLGTFDVLNEGAWSETGELTAYYRAKSSGNLSSLRWEQEDPTLEKNEMGRKLEKRVSSGGIAVDPSSGGGASSQKGEQGSNSGGDNKPGIREGLGALLDTIGLGSFV